MNEPVLITLVIAAATVATLHSLAPDHWAPFAALARARGWSAARTARVTLLCGIGHVTVSAVLGLIAIALGAEIIGALGAKLESIAGILLITFGLWQATLQGERAHVRAVVQEKADLLRDATAARLTERVQALERMARRWEASGQPAEAAWRADAIAHLEHGGDYRAIVWVDADGIIRWIEPLTGLERLVGTSARLTPVSGATSATVARATRSSIAMRSGPWLPCARSCRLASTSIRKTTEAAQRWASAPSSSCRLGFTTACAAGRVSVAR